MYFLIFTFFIMAPYMVKLVCFIISPRTTYRYILYWLPGKLTSNRASWNYAKLGASAFQNRSSYTSLFFLFINLSEMSIQKMTKGIIFNLKKNLDVNFHKKLEPVYVKHVLPNICLPLWPSLHSAVFPQNKIGFCTKVKQVIYLLSPFQTPSSNLADKDEMTFAKVHNSRKIWRSFSNVNQLINSSSQKIQVPSLNSFWNILLTSLKCPNFAKGHNSGKKLTDFFKKYQVIYPSTPISWPSFKPL